jgi:hypothetical protein
MLCDQRVLAVSELVPVAEGTTIPDVMARVAVMVIAYTAFSTCKENLH